MKIRTLTADNLNAHARMIGPMNGLEANKARCDWLFEIRMFHGVRVRVAFENLSHSCTPTTTATVGYRGFLPQHFGPLMTHNLDQSTGQGPRSGQSTGQVRP